MTLEQIKQAIADGKRVCWSNEGYEVILDKCGQFLIVWDRFGRGENCASLTHADGVTLNGKAEEFYIYVANCRADNYPC